MAIINVICLCMCIGCLCWQIKTTKHDNSQTSNKIIRKKGLLYIQCFRIYGECFIDKPKLLLIDTGATANFIDEDLIRKIYPSYEKHLLYGDDVLTANGTLTLNTLVNVPLRVDNSDIEESFTLLKQATTFEYLSQESGYDVIGIVGTKFLSKYKYILNC